jgi:hypothetical protein
LTATLRNFAALLVGLAFTGCTQTVEPFRSSVTQTGPDARLRAPVASARGVPHLSTSVEVEERSYATGNNVPLVLSVSNHERIPVTIPALGCALLYVVYDQRGTQVSGGFVCGNDVFPVITLNAGETVQRKMEWLASTYYYDDGLVFVPLPPGTYRIHAYLVPLSPLSWDTYLSTPHVVRLLEQEPASSAARF